LNPWILLVVLAACSAPGPTATELRDALGPCDPLEGVPSFHTDIGDDDAPTGDEVPICTAGDVVWWTADLDVDCDGGTSDACHADESYQSETAATGADGGPLDASTIPYVVVPLPADPLGPRDADFFYCDHGLALGGPVAVLYGDAVAYAVIGDEGPVTAEPEGADDSCEGTPFSGGVLGEGSWALADRLGIDPDPNTGGVECDGSCPVTYVFFAAAAIDPADDVAAAEREGARLADAFVRR
jgi:hypothetical protein